MDIQNPIAVFWFRRDLRLSDNKALYEALVSGRKVLPLFIFDTEILKNLPPNDKRISFIYQALDKLNRELLPYHTSIQVYKGIPSEVFVLLSTLYPILDVYVNQDYEPYATARDQHIKTILNQKSIAFHAFKDQVIFEKDEVVKDSGEPYTVFTPYSRRWFAKLKQDEQVLKPWLSEKHLHALLQVPAKTITLKEIGFAEETNMFSPFQLNTSAIETYDATRNIPSLDTTSRAGVHLRFGTISIRDMVTRAGVLNAAWLNELVWREFFMQILWHFPHVAGQSFNPKYRFIPWVNNEKDFELWCSGNTGYPLVDAGMRELNATGFMHNRVRMVTASFLVKHLLVNWQWGEAYFAEKLLDFELSSNNGNWQWAAGTGCDAAPYFRIFNPESQAVKFDPENIYIRKWVPEFGTRSYNKPIIDHVFARTRCLTTYKSALERSF